MSNIGIVSKPILKKDWTRFEQACLFSDIKLLIKTAHVLRLGKSLYWNCNGQISLAGLGVCPHKFDKALKIVDQVISLKLEMRKKSRLAVS